MVSLVYQETPSVRIIKSAEEPGFPPLNSEDDTSMEALCATVSFHEGL